MATVESLMVYPLAGAQGNVCQEATLASGGFIGDHDYLLYAVNEKEGGFDRFSQKQCRDLAKLAVAVGTDEMFIGGGRDWEHLLALTIPLAQTSLVDVVEFGDVTPCEDMGEDAAEFFSDYVDKEVRLARKTDNWITGGVLIPSDRAVAPVHLIVRETVDELASRLADSDDDGLPFGPDRFRPQVVVANAYPRAEVGWLGQDLQIGGATLHVDRLTKRCPVPGTDQRTGERMNDVPRIYPYTYRAPDDHKPTVGVYAHLSSEHPVTIHVGDKVKLLPA